MGAVAKLRRLSQLLAAFGFAGLAACGGRVIDDGSGSSEPSAPASTATTSGGKSSSSGSLPSHELGACQPGFVRAEHPGRACHWLTESGLCFDDTEGACACICPRNRDSVCGHGFDKG